LNQQRFATRLGAECLGEARSDLVVVVAGEQPAFALERLDQLGGKRVEDGRRVGQRGRPALGGRGEARKQHLAGELERVAQLVVHAHLLLRRPGRRGVDAAGAGLPRREGLLLRHQAGGQPLEDGADIGRIAQFEAADQH